MQNLHSHTSYSNLFASFKDSHVSYADYCKRAHEVGQRVVASTEHGFQGNYLRCWEAVQNFNEKNEANLKFVYGTEAYWVKDRKVDDNTNGHILILARNKEGIYEINEMLSTANEDGYYYRPRVDMELLTKLTPSNVLVTTACVSGWAKIDKESATVRWYYSPDDENSPAWVEDRVRQLKAHFGSSLYLEVQAHNTPWQVEINRECLMLHYELGIPLIVGLDSHYIYPEQYDERRYLREESGVRMNDEDHEISDNVYEDYPDEQTLIYRFTKQGVLSASEIREAMDNTDVALTFEDIEFDRTRKLPPYDPNMTQEERNALYIEHVKAGLENYKKTVPPEKYHEYDEAIAYETNNVVPPGVADYFLINEYSVREGVANGGVITPTGRGSAGGQLSNTMIELSTLDRLSLPVKLYPERFITADRLKTSLPDIDFNVSDQEPFVRAQEKLLGKGHIYPMIAYGTLKTKSAFKVYARANNMEASLQNEITKEIDRYETALKHAEDDEKDTIDIADYVEAQYLPYIENSKPYQGIIVSKSQAPCGFLLYAGDIRREIGIMRVASKSTKKVSYCTVIDGYTADAFGYVKNDWLVVAVVDVNARAMKLAGLPSYTSKEIIELTKNDPRTWDIFAKGYTMGINQCEKDQTTARLKQYRPRCLEDLSAFVAAIRPGFKSQLKEFIAREKFSYNIPSFDALLKNDSTGSSWLLYQENIMTCLNMAGFSMEETYPIIKAISKKKSSVIDSAKPRFLEGFSKHIMDNEHVDESAAMSASEKVWKVIEDSASYSFNAAHAVAVALDALYGAYLKAHYPYEYYVSLLSKVAEKGNKDRMAKIRAEMRRAFNITFVPCQFGQDNTKFIIDKENHSISDVIMSIKGLSASSGRALAELGEGFYASFVDVLYAMEYDRNMTSAKVSTLIKLGYFKDFGGTGKLMKIFNAFNDGEFAFKKTYVDKTQRVRLQKLEEYEASLEDSELADRERLAFEIEVYGTPLSTFPNLKKEMAVVEVDDKYGIKLVAYNPRNGVTGQMKIKKQDYASKPLKAGDIIKVINWKDSPVYSYSDGKRTPIPGSKELWLTSYEKVC